MLSVSVIRLWLQFFRVPSKLCVALLYRNDANIDIGIWFQIKCYSDVCELATNNKIVILTYQTDTAVYGFIQFLQLFII